MRRASLVLILLGVSTGLFAQDGDRIADLSSKGARVVRASHAGRLTSPSNDARPDIVSSFLRGRHDPATVDSLVLAGENVTARGAVHLRFTSVEPAGGRWGRAAHFPRL